MYLKAKKMKLVIYLTIFINLFVGGQPGTLFADKLKASSDGKTDQGKIKYKYQYVEKDHSKSDVFYDIAFCYGVTWVIYPIGQPNIFTEDDGSSDRYKDNFGDVVFDQDEPFWNFFVHPIMGSQLYLYYRANGYTKWEAFELTSLSSMLFEFTVEIYSEPASFQDLYNTPVFGTILGLGLEKLSLEMLNSDNVVSRFFGHVINPSTLFWFYDGKVEVTPLIRSKDHYGLSLNMVF
jgi:hypothetical protein